MYNENPIFLVDTYSGGHHKFYSRLVLEALKQSFPNRKIIFIGYNLDLGYVDEKIEFIEINVLKKTSNKFKIFYFRLRWINKIFKYIKLYKPTKIHFLESTQIISLAYYFKLRCLLLKDEIEMSLTIHHFPNNFIKIYNLRFISKCFNNIVVHGDWFKKDALKKEIKNLLSIEYPSDEKLSVKKSVAREKLNIPKSKLVLLIMGETRYKKGLDIILDNLNRINFDNIFIVIAGKPTFFSEKYIKSRTEGYNNIKLDLNFISDKKFKMYFCAGDFVILPYRKSFSGQSGPLIEGVKNNCKIISSDHGQIGYSVKNYKLGKVFNIDMSKSLINIINSIDYEDMKLNEKFLLYKKKISKENFINNYCEMFNLSNDS